ITLEGTRRNCRMVIEYVEGWLNGRGAKGIDSLEGRPGIHPALMEDLATGRMSVAQIAQRIRHHVRTTDGTGPVHDFAVVKRLLGDELTDILARRPADPVVQARYRKSVKIAMRWIKNYVDLDFRSLASYTRGDLEKIAAARDAFWALTLEGPFRFPPTPPHSRGARPIIDLGDPCRFPQTPSFTWRATTVTTETYIC